MIHKDKVSIIVPIYNVAKYLRECLDSIDRQTYKNIEIILIDDGSTDESPQICDEYCKKNSNIKVVHQENQGVSIARNVGIDLATGVYIVFIDPDDIVSDLFVEALVNTAYHDNCQLVGINYCYEKKELATHIKDKKTIFEGYKIKNIYEDFINKKQACYLSGYVWAYIFLKRIIDDNNIRFLPKVSVWEDRLFVTEYINYINKYVFLDDNLYYYRQHNDSAVNVMGIDKYESKIIVNHRLLQICQCKSIGNEELLLRDYFFSMIDYGFKVRKNNNKCRKIYQTVKTNYSKKKLDINRKIKLFIIRINAIKK